MSNATPTRERAHEIIDQGTLMSLVRKVPRGVPLGDMRVDADALRQARRNVPRGEFHVDADALRQARRNVPRGEFHVDADALRQARRNVPRGEFHLPSAASDLLSDEDAPLGGVLHACVVAELTSWTTAARTARSGSSSVVFPELAGSSRHEGEHDD